MLSNVIAPQHLKIKHAHIEHQKKDMSAFYLLRTIIWHFGALSGLSQTLERAALYNCGEWPRWPAKSIRQLGSRCMTFKLASNDGR